MSDIKDPTWGDTGFDDASDDGFLQPEPPAKDQAQPRRMVMPPPPPPPSRSRDHGGRGFRVVVGALIVLIIALGGVLTWHLFFRITPGSNDVSQSSRDTVTSTPQASVADVAPPAIDTGVVVQAETTPTVSSAPKLAAQESTTQMTTRPAPTTNEPMYVVQVFSSPSRDDADEWVQILRNKNITDVYVAEQPIKGQMWYRVRFGQYARREDAEFAAVKVGVAQPWIARIR